MLAKVHKVTVGAGVALALLFGTYSVVHQNWAMVGFSVIMAVALSFYLRWFVRKSR